MALCELNETQVKNVVGWLKSLSIQANYEQRQKFDAELNSVLSALNKPIQLTGKPKE